VYELRTATGGRVVRVEVDEGQMVAEDDEIVLLQSDSRSVMVVTDVPGVVRELYVEAGLVVGAGAVVALIDEA
jgi:multidrug efflux pump subunit AcrA (membrane-fusion protein)